MSGDGKDAGQETADEVHPPCPPVEPKTEELDREDDCGTLAQEICSSAAMSGHGKDAGQERADKVHPPSPAVEPKTEELDREDDRGTELHGLGSPEKVPQASSIKRGKKRRRSVDQSMVESGRNQDRPSTPDADGHSWRLFGLQFSSAQGWIQSGSPRNELFKWRTFHPLGEAAVEQEAEAATGNTGSGQGTSCWPFPRGSKKKNKN